MNIGQKVKALRISKMMTQTELAGEFITRNMLSRIENGSALPSVPTVVYLAGRLGVPSGFLLSEENEEPYYRKMTAIGNIRSAFRSGNFEICRDLCLESYEDDDEINFLLAESSFRSGVVRFRAGELRDACIMFDDTCKYASLSAYSNGTVIQKAKTYLSYIHEISPSLDAESLEYGYIPDEDVLDSAFCRYVWALDRIDSGAFDSIRELPPLEAPYKTHAEARFAMSKNSNERATELLSDILRSEDEIPMPILYTVFSDLEECFRISGNERAAFEYSENKLELLTRFLR